MSWFVALLVQIFLFRYSLVKLLKAYFHINQKNHRVFIKYFVFSFKCCDSSELCQFYCSAGVLPAWCVYTHWQKRKQRKTRVLNILKVLSFRTILVSTSWNIIFVHLNFFFRSHQKLKILDIQNDNIDWITIISSYPLYIYRYLHKI